MSGAGVRRIFDFLFRGTLHAFGKRPTVVRCVVGSSRVIVLRGVSAVRVFIWEYLCGGACFAEPLDGSLAREGRAMLLALVEDFLQVEGCRVATTWDARLGAFPLAGVDVRVITKDDEARVFVGELGRCDAALVVAPEFEGILEARTAQVEASGVRCLGSSTDAVRICADKLACHQRLADAGVPTITTKAVRDDLIPCDDEFPLVCKPRFGAGSTDTWLIESSDDWSRMLEEIDRESLMQMVWQPFVGGQAASVGVLLSAERESPAILPLAEQRLSEDGRFRYLGGTIPLAHAGGDLQEWRAAVEAACRTCPGLSGYAGIDLVFPESKDKTPIVVEINPRVTTSYVGYRRGLTGNLAQEILSPAKSVASLRWSEETIVFRSDGRRA